MNYHSDQQAIQVYLQICF